MSKDDKDIEQMRHSASHLLAAAVLNLYPDTKFGIGPAIENGFYYDFGFSKPISDKDLPLAFILLILQSLIRVYLIRKSDKRMKER